jgi:N-acetylmuramoyl-L-alanine amidase
MIAGNFGYALPWSLSELELGPRPPLWNYEIAIISGHAGFDAGAVCLDEQGQAVLTEAEVNLGVAEKTVAQLTELGATAHLLEEYDARLNNLQADLLLSLHADSCVPASGFKAANFAHSRIPLTEARLLSCINRYYAQGTGLAEHPNTVTHDMTEYHAFKRIHHQTPAAILEMGFLGGDQALLTQEQDRIAHAIVEATRCFLIAEENETPNGDNSTNATESTVTDTDAPNTGGADSDLLDANGTDTNLESNEE